VAIRHRLSSYCITRIAKKHHYEAGDVKALMEKKTVKNGREELDKLRIFTEFQGLV
jgi:hypothetical protein